MPSRQRLEQIAHPERLRARTAVHLAVREGRLPSPTTLNCTDEVLPEGWRFQWLPSQEWGHLCADCGAARDANRRTHSAEAAP